MTSARDVARHTDVVRQGSRAHSAYVRDNGAFETRDALGAVILGERDADGAGVELE